VIELNGIELLGLNTVKTGGIKNQNAENKILKDNPCFLEVLSDLLNEGQDADEVLEDVFENLDVIENLNGFHKALSEPAVKTTDIAKKGFCNFKNDDEKAETKENEQMLLEQILLNLIIDVVNNDQCNSVLKETLQGIEMIHYETDKIPVKEIYDILTRLSITKLSEGQDISDENIKSELNMLIGKLNDLNEDNLSAAEEELITRNVNKYDQINNDEAIKNTDSNFIPEITIKKNIPDLEDNHMNQKIHILKQHEGIEDIFEDKYRSDDVMTDINIGDLVTNNTRIEFENYMGMEEDMKLSDLDQNQFVKMITDKIMYHIKDNQSTATIKLKPDFLGKMGLEIVIDEGILIAEFTVENQHIKALIEQNLTQLKDNLEQCGVSVEGFNVSVNHNNGNESYPEFKKNSSKYIVIDQGNEQNSDTLMKIINAYSFWEENHVNYTV